MVSFLRSNLVWMLLSLLLSSGLWVYVTFRQDPEGLHLMENIPIVVQGQPKTMVVQPETTAVQVEVIASKEVWAQLKPEEFKAIVDASKVTPGSQEVDVTVTTTDPRVRIQSYEPSKILLKVDPLKTKTVPVRVITSGTVPFGYNVGAAQVIPDTVSISGPAQLVDPITAAAVTVDVNGATKSIDQGYRPVLEGVSESDASRITLDPGQVRVEVPIEQKLLYKTVPVSPTIVGNVALGYEVVGFSADPQTVLLVGDPQTLDQMNTVPTEPIDVSGADGDRAYNTSLALPGTVAMAGPQSIVVRVLVSTVNGSKTLLVGPQVTNLGPGLTYQVNPGAVNVTLAGPIPVLNRVQPSDVVVTIDATGITSGTQSVNVQVKTPDLLKLVSVRPQRVTLTVK